MTSINYILGAIIYFDLLIISFELIKESNDNDNYKNLNINKKEIKYLNPTQEDKYKIVFKNKIMINLIVLSGYAYFAYDKSTLNNKPKIKEKSLGYNHRVVLTLEEETNNEKTFSFSLKAKNEGAIYYLIATDIISDTGKESIWPLEISGVESFSDDFMHLKFIDLNNEINNNEQNKSIAIFFNPINCQFNIKDKEIDRETKDENFVNIIKKIKSSQSKIEFNLNNDYNNNNNCYFFVGSVKMDEKSDSYLILPEGKSLKFKMNNEFKKLKTKFYYAFSSSSSLTESKLYVRISSINKIPIKLKIEINDNKILENDLFLSKDILIYDFESKNNDFNLKNDTLYEIKMTFELTENITIGNTPKFDINIKTLKKIPKFIKKNEIFTDIIMNNHKDNINYYITPVDFGSKGEIKLSFKMGSGFMYGKIINFTSLMDTNKWNNISLPRENSPGLLNFLFYEQKIIFKKNDTKFCGSYCYLIFGVKPNTDNQNNELFSEYNIYYIDDYVEIPEGRYIFNTLSKKNDLYKYYINTNMEFIYIEFKSTKCILQFSFNNKIFKANNTYIGDGKNLIIQIPKNNNTILFIKIGKIGNDISDDDINLFYRLKVIESNPLLKDKVIIDTNHPFYFDEQSLKKDGNSYYCDFIVILNNIYKNNTIVEIFAEELHSIDNDNLLYYNIFNLDTFYKNMTYGILEENWPNKTNNSSFIPRKDYSNNVSISINDSYQNDEKKVIDLILAFRLYNNKKASIELHSFIHTNFIKENENISVTPFINEYQYLTCYNNNKIILNIPDDDDYYLKIITISKKGMISIDDNEKFIKNGLILNNIRNKTIQISKDSEEVSIDDYNFFLFYKKSDGDNQASKNSERIRLKSSYEFIHYNEYIPITFFMNITKVNLDNDLYYYIYLYNFDAEDTSENLDSKMEKFNIKAYLIKDTNYSLSNLNDGKNEEILGIYDAAYHQGRLIIPSEKIKTSRKQLSLIIKIEPAEEKTKKYNLLEGNLFFIERNAKSELFQNAPKNIYLSNYFKNASNQQNISFEHNYLLKFSELDKKRFKAISFATITKNVTIAIYEKYENNILSNKKNITLVNKNINKGSDIYLIETESANEFYLNIKCPGRNYEVDYTFKYFILDSDNYPFQYDNKIQSKKSSKFSTDIDLTISKIQPQNIIENANYYIRIYEVNESNKLGDLKITTSFRNQRPYSIQKIIPHINQSLSNSDDDAYFHTTIKTDIAINYFIDVIAEVIKGEMHEYLAYERFNPIYNQYEGKKRRLNKFIIIIFSSIGLVLLIIVLILFISFCRYRKKHKNLAKKVEQISFNDETKNKDDDDDDDDDLLA